MPQKILQKILRWSLSLLAVLLLALVGYMVSLDAEIRERFNGVRWQLPAQVYAAPLDLYAGQRLSSSEFQQELQRLGYRLSAKLDTTGVYNVGLDGFTVRTRAFQFWDVAQPAMTLKVRISDTQVTEVRNQETGEVLAITRLDPLLIGSIYPNRGGEDRSLIRLNDVPSLLKDGLVYIEDRNFYSHFGISLRGLARATLANIQAGKAVQGASTITQQLVKNFFLTSERTLSRKLKEVCMAFLLELHYSKDQILEAYMNEIFMGQDGNRAVHGFGLASQLYFNKPLNELRPHEAALLVTVVRGASQYNPRSDKGKIASLARRNSILERWAEAGLITPEEASAASKEVLQIAGSGRGVERYPAFVELVKKQLLSQYPEDELLGEGLRIFTTLNIRSQEMLEKHLSQGLAQLEKGSKRAKGIEGAGVITSVEGGEILAVVAGRDARFPGFNRAVDARRPIGSLSKPLVYLSALLQPERFNVRSLLNDEPITWKQAGTKAWNPQNYDRAVHGPVPLYRALAKSYNLATVWLGQEVGIDAVRKTFEKAGMADPPKNPSMLLGAIDLSPVDVAQLYNTLASGGYHTPLTAIREVLTKDGQPLTRFPMKTEQRLPEAAVYLLNWSLRHVLTEGTGVGALATLGDSAVVGKTGTTDDLRDAWFAGYGADKVGVIWIGRDDNQPMGYTGGSGALPIWAKVMRDLRVQSWNSEPPAEVIMAPIDPYTGGLAEGCLESVLLPFTSGYQPPPAPCSGGVPLDSSLAVPEGLEGVEGETMPPETPETNQAAPESPPPNPPKPEKSLLEQFFE